MGRYALIAAGCCLAVAARADERGDARAAVQLFVEPAASQRVVVVSPSASGRADVTRFLNVQASFDADIVSGATPRTYGAPDAVSAATAFSDERYTFAARASGRFGPATVDAGYRFGFEHDYRSHVVGAGASVDLARRNTTLAASWAHNFDSVCDLDNGALATTLRQPLTTSRGCFAGTRGLTGESLAIDGVEASVTQVVTPRLVGQLVGAWEHLDGFQSNPYRRVRLDGGAIEAQESHPRLRDRFAVGLRARFALPAARAALAGDLRLYRDTWAVQSITVEAAWEQHLGAHLLLKLRARYYQQSAAFFYRDAGDANSYENAGPVGAYFTGDRELAPLADLLVGARLTVVAGRALGRLTDLEGAARLDLVDVFALSPLPPNADRTRGVVDALTAGLSLTGRF